MSIAKHSYSGDTFNNLFDTFKPKDNKPRDVITMVKVAGGCLVCPMLGKTSCEACNSCKFASGISFKDDTSYIKCSYSKQEALVKEASAVQGIHWVNDSMPSQEKYNTVKEDIKSNIIEELKYAARQVGVKLADQHLSDFADEAVRDKLGGRKLEKAAKRFVMKINERLAMPSRTKNAGKIDEVFDAVTKNSKTILSGISETNDGDSTKGGGKYLGSVVNPNSIWDSGALTKAAQTPSSDEVTKKNKEKIAEKKESAKEAYWDALQKQLSDKGLVSQAKIHSTHTIPTRAFNNNIPENSMGIFGDHKEFENIPEKTAGEKIAEDNAVRASKKSEENKEVQIKAAKTAESGNWLFKNV